GPPSPARPPQVAFHVSPGAAPATSLAEVIDQPAVGHLPFRRNVEAPDLAVASRTVVAVHDVESLAVRADRDAVGLLHLRLAQDAIHFAVRIDPVDTFNVHLHAGAVSVAGVGEPDAALAIDAEVVRAVVALALVALGQNGNLPRLHVGADDAPAPPRPQAEAFAGDELALGVEGVAVRPAAVGAEDGHLTAGAHL